jgi:hypothetical protein
MKILRTLSMTPRNMTIILSVGLCGLLLTCEADRTRQSDRSPGVQTPSATPSMAPQVTLESPVQPSKTEILAELEGIVFEDRNANGNQDDQEPGIAGVKIVLVRDHRSQFTDDRGKFLFGQVEPGPQAVGLDETTLPTGYRLRTESTVLITLTEGDKGYVKFGVRQ